MNRPRKKWTDKLKEPYESGNGWGKVLSKFTLKDGEVLLIQYKEGDEPEQEALERLGDHIKASKVNATVLVLPAELRVEHVTLNRVGDLLDTILELAENALREGRKDGQNNTGADISNRGSESERGVAQRGSQGAHHGGQGADAAQD